MQQQLQRSQHLQSYFIHGGVRYNIQSTKWKQLKIKTTPQNQQCFFGFQDNQYAIIKNSIYCLASSALNPTKSSLYSYNIVNEQIKEWRADAQSNYPQIRKNYGFIAFNQRLYLFGGVRQFKYFNDLTSYCPYNNTWIPVLNQTNTIFPSPRIPFVFTEIQNGNILLFGGFIQNRFLTDAYLLVDSAWKPLRPVNIQSFEHNYGNFFQIANKKGIKYCAGKGCVYLFGGYIQDRFSNQFYEVKVNQQLLTITITKINSEFGPRPSPRAFHSMQKLGQTSFALYGGINSTSVALRDISIFDLIQRKWTQVNPINNPLPFISYPKLYYSMNGLYIIGILNDKNIPRKGILQLIFSQFQIVKTQICSNCIKRLQVKQKQQLNTPKKPFISNGLIYNIAMQLSSPFQAISLLTDCAQILQATQLSIKNQQTNNKLTYLDIRFNGNPLTRQQYSSIVSHSYLADPVVLEIIQKIKLGSMRLGKTLIFITIVNNFRRVFVFSADGLVISHYHEIYSYFSYEQRITDQWLSTQQSINHKKFIMNLLHSYFPNPQQIITSVKNHCMLIFESNVIMTTQKIYYGQLLTNSSDIVQCKSNKKVEFLDALGFQLHQDPQVSLSKYIEYTYLNPVIKTVRIQNKQFNLKSNKYLQQLEKLQENQVIRSLCGQKLAIREIQAECWLYQVSDPNIYIKQLKGILIYFKGRLINRLDVKIGDLFWQKFYKSKYKKPFGLWNHVGVINFTQGIQPKSLRNQFKNDNSFNLFIRHIKKQYLNKSSQLKIILNNDYEDQMKGNKQVKRQKQ